MKKILFTPAPCIFMSISLNGEKMRRYNHFDNFAENILVDMKCTQAVFYVEIL